MKKWTFLWVLLSLLSFGCKKDDPEQVFRLSKDFKAFCRFPVGSWWVYQDSSGAKDSLWVIKSEILEKNNSNLSDWLSYHQKLSQHIQSSSTKYIFTSEVSSSYKDDEGNEHRIFLYLEFYEVGELTEGMDRFKWEPNNNYDVGTNVQHYHHYESFPVLDSIYGDVHVFGYPTSTYGNTIHKEYFARGIGVVQREMFDGTVWKLNRYHIAM